ncbi:MAG: DUF998 domain-containing protein [Anaerolineales bacterium]|nr:DUF998 domain-containing protein [Anaerolineales bacterium]
MPLRFPKANIRKMERKGIMGKRTMENWLCLSGVIAAIFYFLHVLLGTLNYPGYDSLSQAVSDLTAVDSPSYQVASGLSNIYGALACLCCTIVIILIKREKSKLFKAGIVLYTIMNWVSFIGYTLFPLSGKGFIGTIQDIFHFYVVTIMVVLFSIVSLIFIFISGMKTEKYRALGVMGLIALILMFVGSLGTGLAPKEYFGLMERFSTFSVVLYTAVVGIFGFRFQGEKL